MADTTTISTAIAERTTRILSGTLLDETNTPIPGSSLTTATFTLYDLESLRVINSRTDVDIKANINGSGALSLELLPADNIIVRQPRPQEVHVALIEFTYSSGTKRGQHEIYFTVTNSHKVP
jgi:hypothetical protein